MPKCDHCGKKFGVDDARSEFDAFEAEGWDGELTYDEAVEGELICGSCAIDYAAENMSAGRAMQFSLETGLDPADVPDDWSPSADGGVAPW